MGNHDWALLNSPIGFNSIAARMIEVTKRWMQPGEDADEDTLKRWNFLSERPRRFKKDSFFLVHGSPRHALTEYVLPTDVQYDPDKFDEIFDMIDQYCLIGHSHYPCVIFEDREVVVPRRNHVEVELGSQKAIINVGSVGQPRDGDERACFITLDDKLVRFHRIDYDFNKTVEKINKLGEQFEVLGYRLSIGR
jgi:diadenosine tetraphosphatase ApaH/serine/threonine PP2A family protein phosphatase